MPQFVLHSGGTTRQIFADYSSHPSVERERFFKWPERHFCFDASFHSTSRWQHRAAFLEPRVTDCLWGLKSIDQSLNIRRAPLCGKRLDVRVGKQVSVPFKNNILSHWYRFDTNRFDAMINICL